MQLPFVRCRQSDTDAARNEYRRQNDGCRNHYAHCSGRIFRAGYDGVEKKERDHCEQRRTPRRRKRCVQPFDPLKKYAVRRARFRACDDNQRGIRYEAERDRHTRNRVAVQRKSEKLQKSDRPHAVGDQQQYNKDDSRNRFVEKRYDDGDADKALYERKGNRADEFHLFPSGVV